MFDYLLSWVRALGGGLVDGTSREPKPYVGSTIEMGLHRAGSDAVRIILYGPRR